MRRVAAAIVVLGICCFLTGALYAQSSSASLTGLVTDPSKAVIVGAKITAINEGTNVRYEGATNSSGSYYVTGLPPGMYRVEVEKTGFKTVLKPSVILHVQDTIELNFDMAVGSTTESVTVEGGAPVVNTQDATVSTVVDRQFADNLPLNGRSFQALIQLTPGVVLVPSNAGDSGQFSINGQRAASNYWMVDGVGANIGIGLTGISNPGNGLGGTLGSFSVLGGTNSLVSVDAMQEFRIQTSTFAPEFGRTPGGQVSIVTRSGTNHFHGSAFEYLRNDALDANNWFNTFVSPPLSKAKERQNDFGGTLSGPLWKNRTFFFFSYEGFRLRLPQTTLSTVPDVAARQSAVPSAKPLLNAYPLPNGQDNATTGVAQFNASYSNPASLDAYSLRLDHKLNDKLSLFLRYNDSPSRLMQRGSGSDALSSVNTARIRIQTLTLGTTALFSSTVANDLRVNYSRTEASSRNDVDTFGGAVPFVTSVSLASPFTFQNALFSTFITGLKQPNVRAGDLLSNLQRQINLVDNISIQRNSHSVKVGADVQRLTPSYLPRNYILGLRFANVTKAMNGLLSSTTTASGVSATFGLYNVGLYAQDSWRISPRLTMTYGLRWDIDVAPSSSRGPRLAAANNVDLSNLASAALAPPSSAPYATTYGNIAPRVGFAYNARPATDWGLVIRGGVGVFYDLPTSEMGNLIQQSQYPFGSSATRSGGSLPLTPTSIAPPPITAPGGGKGTLAAFDPHLDLPYTLQWNLALEEGLGRRQTLSTSYVGAAGRRLLQTVEAFGPSPNYSFGEFVTNGASSDYHALQLQFRRELSSGLQALASYSWSHSIDTASAGSFFSVSNFLVPGSNSGFSLNRGSSDFDIRQTLSVGLTYDIPAPKTKNFGAAILQGWSLQNTIQARTAPPVDVSDFTFFQLSNGIVLDVRPDRIPSQPLYLVGSQYPGGKALNPAAFSDPPGDPDTGIPNRQGNLGRNAVRGFGAAEWDLAVHRDFPIRESLKVQFRGELFNVLNHPNFGQPSGQFGVGGFGLSSQMLGQSLTGTNLGGGGFSALYQMGGPRSVQLALKLTF